jgi:hypothetical protein
MAKLSKAEYIFDGIYIDKDQNKKTANFLVLTIDYDNSKYSVVPCKEVIMDGMVYRVSADLGDSDFLISILSTTIKAIKFAKKELVNNAISKSKFLKHI